VTAPVDAGQPSSSLSAQRFDGDYCPDTLEQLHPMSASEDRPLGGITQWIISAARSFAIFFSLLGWIKG